MRPNTLRQIWRRGEAVVRMVAAGYQFVTLASDSRFLAAKAAEEVAAVRKTAGGGGRLPAY